MMSDAREALVALIPPPRAPEHVDHWPQDERDYYRHGDFADWSERLEGLDRMRREKVADAILAAGWTPPGEDQWWESLVETACDKGHRVFIDDGDGGVYACPACALLPTVKPSVEDVAAAIETETATYDPVTSPEQGKPESLLAADGSDMSLSAARAVLALLPGRTEAEVKAEGWDEGAQAGLDAGLTIAESVHANGGVLDLADVPHAPVNPYRKEAEHG